MGRSAVSGFMWMGRAKALVLGVAAALVASVSILVVVMRPAEAAFPGSTGDIVFATDRDVATQFQIYRMGADGYDPEKLSDTAGNNDQPAWSSDGKMIAFTNTQADSEVYVMDHDGDPEVNVTDHPAKDEEAAFFPGQRKIAFFSNRSDAQATTDNDIYALTFDNNLNTTEVIQLTKSNSADQSPAVSSSGKKIAFMSNRDGDFEIYVMKAAPESPTNVPKKLTKNTAGDVDPDWSPDGRRIVFVSERSGSGNNEIFVMNADGTNQKNLTSTQIASAFEPVFSPDGKKIAFTSNRDAGDNEIWRMRADGTNPVNLTNTTSTVSDFRPSWQPIP